MIKDKDIISLEYWSNLNRRFDQRGWTIISTGSIKHTYLWSSRRVTSRRLIMGEYGIKQQKTRPFLVSFFARLLAVVFVEIRWIWDKITLD